MSRSHFAWILTAAFLASADCSEAIAQTPEFEERPVGVAQLDVTPDGAVRLAGYGNRQTESEGIASRIWTKALAIGGDEGEGPVVWITLENCGMTPAIREQVTSALAQSHRIPAARIAISVTHTHTAPCLTLWAPYLFASDIPPVHQRHIDAYTAEVTRRMIDVAERALAARVPARLSWGVGEVGFAVNRRVISQERWSDFGVQEKGPVDHRLPLLAAHSRDGKLLACLVTYSCHCTTFDGSFNQVAGDWAGAAQTAIEADHPGAIAMVTIGCGADANPHPRGDDPSTSATHGRTVADEVARLLKTDLRPLRGAITCQADTIELPFAELRSEEEWERRSKEPGVVGYHAAQFLNRLRQGETIPPTLPYSLSTWAFGDDLVMVFLSGEVVVDYALRLRELLDPDRLWVIAYSHDVPCYIPSRRILREGGYEADTSMLYYARPNALDPQVEDLLVDEVQRITPHRFYGENTKVDYPPPKSPEESLRAIQVPEGFRVDQIAAEPLVADPVAIDFGPDGRIWIVEMGDYPNGMDWRRPGDPFGTPGGRVTVLSDRDQDGIYDASRVFVDKLAFPNGVKVWRDGVLIYGSSSLIYARDIDGDGDCDQREDLFTGFGDANPQHRANGLVWGLDNWMYSGNGADSGRIHSVKTGEIVPISGRDFRFHPDDSRLETQAGATQFGRCRDDWNSWFGGDNSNPLWHYVLDDVYLARNPHVSYPPVHRDVVEVPGAAPVFPRSRSLARFNDFYALNRFTSACSPDIYRDLPLTKVLGSGTGHVFICEPVHNLVHRELMRSEGVTFRSRRAETEQSSEFFTSTDNWCRPVVARTGPDGALWIVDMYRQVVEHPEWIPVSYQRRLDLRAGADRGRIYRVGLAEDGGPRPLPRLDRLDTPGLVAELDHANGWRRDIAHQLLLWRNDPAMIPLLKRAAAKSANPLGRLHALCVLDGIAAQPSPLTAELLRTALADAYPGVRRHAVRLAESRQSSAPELGSALARLQTDPDPLVRMQVAYSLGAWADDRASEALAEMALANHTEPNLLAAIISSVSASHVEAFTRRIAALGAPPEAVWEPLLATALGWNAPSAVNRVMELALAGAVDEPAATRYRIAAQLLEATSRTTSDHPPTIDPDVRGKLTALTDEARRLVRVLGQVDPDDEASQGAGSKEGSSSTERPATALEESLAAIRLLGAAESSPGDAELLGELLVPRQAPEIQAAAVAAMARIDLTRLATLVVRDFRAYPASLRGDMLEAVFQRPETTLQFVQGIREGVVPVEELDARLRQSLRTHPEAAVRDQVNELFQETMSPDREVLVKALLPEVSKPSDAAAGKLVFEKRCAICHQLEGIGHAVGPDLMALTDKSPQAMLIAILDPNRAVESKYMDYVGATTAGAQVSGMIAEETSSGVTLVGAEGKRLELLRREIEFLRSSGKSLMPEGLERDLPGQDLANVIQYVRSIAPPPKSFPGNHPELAHVRDDGSIRLLAMNARIYGPNLAFEDKYRNLGLWHAPQDFAIWDVQVPKAGSYRVYLDYACDNASSGNHYVISVGDQSSEGKVEGTGSWDAYGGATGGTLQLQAGPAEVLVRPSGVIQGALMDLRQIILQPE